MPDRQQILDHLVGMSHALGNPTREWVILGEGNTSARIGEESFFVKASGTHLGSITDKGFVEVQFEGILALLAQQSLSGDEIEAGLAAARVDPACGLRPSVETFLHARALSAGAATFIGHTHPAVVNAILCSRSAEAAFSGRIFPEEVVVCGPAPVFVPFTDPGLPLARAVWAGVEKHADLYGQWPRVLLLQNHGLITFGQTAQEVVDTMAMAVKVSQVLLGTYTLGGPHFLPDQEVVHLHTDPVEAYRRRMLGMSTQ